MKRVMSLNCPGCGGVVIHDAINNKFKCRDCNQVFNLEEIKKQDKKVPLTSLDKYVCKNCGASIVVDLNTTSTTCTYCNNSVILVGKLKAHDKPDYIILNKTKKSDIDEAFKMLANKNIEIDKRFLKGMKIVKKTPVYIPYYLYTFNMSANINVYLDNYFKGSKKVRLEVKNIPLDASVGLDDSIMTSLFDYDLKKMIKFDYHYLSGHISEMPDEARTRARAKITKLAEDTIRNKYKSPRGQSGVLFVSKHVNVLNVDYILVPVWIVEVMYKGKKYNFYMNGQTKKLVGRSNYVKRSTIIWNLLYLIMVFLLFLIMQEIEIVFLYIIFLTVLLFKRKSSDTVKDVTDLDMFKDKAEFREEYYQ